MLVGIQFSCVVKGMPNHIHIEHLYFKECTFLPISVPQTVWQSEAWKEKRLMTELRAIYICYACACLIVQLAVCFVYHESEPYSCQSWGKQKGESWRRMQRRRAGEQRAGESCRMMTSSQFRIWVTSYLPLHSDTEGNQQKKRVPRHSGYMCPVRGSPSWRRDGGRIDWRWWTINEGIDFRVRVTGWGLEINWNKHINTSSILHPEHTHTLSHIYYKPFLA